MPTSDWLISSSILPGDYYWLTATTGTGQGENLQRGMAYNPYNNHLYIPHRTSSPVLEGIHILSADTGSEVFPGLDISAITNGGTFVLLKIGVAEDGVWQGLEKRRRKLRIMTQFCKGCGACVEACTANSLSLVDGKACVDEDACILCGYCAAACPEFMIRVV